MTRMMHKFVNFIKMRCWCVESDRYFMSSGYPSTPGCWKVHAGREMVSGKDEIAECRGGGGSKAGV